MSFFKLIENTVTGAAQATVGTAKLIASPITNLIDLEADHAGDAIGDIDRGLKKMGKDK